MKSATLAAAATLLSAANALSPDKVLLARSTKTEDLTKPSQNPRLKSVTVQGCFSSPGNLVFNSTLDFNTMGSCAMDLCNKLLGLPVAATSGGNQCYCGKEYPPKKTRVSSSECNIGCTGYDIEMCGGIDAWTVYNTGVTLSVQHSEDDAQQSSTTTSTAPSPTKTQADTPKETIIINNTVSNDENKSEGTNTAGIAAGVVVAVVVVGAAAAGIFFYLRRKKIREIEEEHRRNAAVSSFMGKPPSSSGMSITDSRLDPVMAQRRMSDGSIADNQDYSRRILRVINA